MSQSVLNLEVFNKRNGVTGTVVAEDAQTVTIQTEGVNKVVTRGTFKRWYNIIPQENNEKETDHNESVDSEVEEDGKGMPAGDWGIGDQLRAKFLSLVKSKANQLLDFSYDDKLKRDIVKYNGKNVFECTTANRRFNVLCHPKALTPDNYQRADKVYPKEWGWALNVKFIFTDLSQLPLMHSIITDGLFYRQID